MIHQRTLDFHRAHPVARHVEHVVDPPEEPEVSLFVALGAIARDVGGLTPSAPVHLNVAVRIAVDGSEHGGPGPLEDEVAATDLDRFALLVDHFRRNARERPRGRPGFRRRDAGKGSDEDHARLGLPPGVDDRATLTADMLVVPDPGFGVDRLPDGADQAERRQVAACRPVGSPFHERTDRGGCRVKDGDAVPLDHVPEAILLWPVRRAFVHHLRHAIGERSIHDVAVTGHPADVRCTPKHIVLFEIEDPFRRGVRADEVATRCVEDPLRLPGGP